MPRLHLDFDPPLDGPPGFSVGTSELVWFLSWAFAGARYGATHELALTAGSLRKQHGIDLTPLLTFADRAVEEPEDEVELERVWQDAAPLAGCCEAVVQALATDPAFETALAEYPSLRQALADLGTNARRAAEQGARIRITYSMDDEP